jgi:hypothetical protein
MNIKIKIIIMGKTGCEKCDALKEKLNILSQTFDFIDLGNESETLNNHLSKECMVAIIMAGREINALPHLIVVTSGEYMPEFYSAYGYSDGLKIVREVTHD